MRARCRVSQPPVAETGARERGDIIRVVTNASLSGENPYLALFYKSLHNHGIDLVGNMELSQPWLRSNIHSFDAIHFHWPEFLLAQRPAWVRAIQNLPYCWKLSGKLWRASPPFIQLMPLRTFLRFARRQGKQIIWTVHNIAPHERQSRIQHWGFESLASQANLIICHDEATAQACRTRFRTQSRIVVMPHGNYDGCYPSPRPRAVVRRELRIAEHTPLVSCLGGIRHYKGIDVACDAVRILMPNVHLLIAGKRHRLYPADAVYAAATSPHITLIDRILSEQEFADFANASDLILLPYREVTGSGALLAALTFGRGVVASDLPFFRNILSDSPEAGALFPPGDSERMADAIRKCLAANTESRNFAARELADRYDWNHVVFPVVEAMKNQLASMSADA